MQGTSIRVFALLAATFSASARAADNGEQSGIPDGSFAQSLPADLADPGGIRHALGMHGIEFGANYTGEVIGNLSGGLEQSTHYDGLLELHSDIDMEEFIGWRGLSFHASWYQIHGTSG